MLLHLPGFELDEGVGKLAAAPPLAVVADGLVAQIQLEQDAQRADLLVGHIVGLHHKNQAPEGENGVAVKRERETSKGEMRVARVTLTRSLISIEGVLNVHVGADGVIGAAALTDDGGFTVKALLETQRRKSLNESKRNQRKTESEPIVNENLGIKRKSGECCENDQETKISDKNFLKFLVLI